MRCDIDEVMAALVTSIKDLRDAERRPDPLFL